MSFLVAHLSPIEDFTNTTIFQVDGCELIGITAVEPNLCLITIMSEGMSDEHLKQERSRRKYEPLSSMQHLPPFAGTWHATSLQFKSISSGEGFVILLSFRASNLASLCEAKLRRGIPMIVPQSCTYIQRAMIGAKESVIGLDMPAI